MTLPLYNLLGSYYQNVATCEAGNCTYSDTQIQFAVETVTRGIGPRPVPEPGTLGLLGVSLAGMVFLRRRRAPKMGSDPISIAGSTR